MLQPAIFEDIAREAVDFCRLSLGPAATSLANRKGIVTNADSTTFASEQSDLHAHLFLARHLLLLKQLSAVLNLNAKNEVEAGFEMGRVAGEFIPYTKIQYFLTYFCRLRFIAHDESFSLPIVVDV